MKTLAIVWLSFQLMGGGELVIRKDKIVAIMEDRKGMELPPVAVGSKRTPAYYVCIDGVATCLGIEWKQDMKALREKVGAK